MPEITPDWSDQSRCVSVHWTLPVQCVLPGTHRENWHEAWHPASGNRIRYRRSMGIWRTEELTGGTWTVLEIPPPGEDGDEPYARAEVERLRDVNRILAGERDALRAQLETECQVSYGYRDEREALKRRLAAVVGMKSAALAEVRDERDQALARVAELEQEIARVREVCSEPTPHPTHDHLCPDSILRALDGGDQ